MTKAIVKCEEAKLEQSLLHRVFEAGIANHGESAAMLYEDDGVQMRLTTYSKLNQNSNEIANKILETLDNSAKPNAFGDWIIGVCMKHSDLLLETLLAILKVGAAYLPIDENSSVDFIRNQAKPVLIVHDESLNHPEHFESIKTINHSDLKRDSQGMSSENLSDDMTLSKGDLNSKATILFTPQAKGIRISHSNIIHRVNWQLKTYPFAENETHAIMKSPVTHVAHLGEVCSTFAAGKTLVIVPKDKLDDIKSFVDLLEEFKIRRVSGEPTLLQNVLLHVKTREPLLEPKILLSDLKLWISYGEALPRQLAQTFFEYFVCGKHMLINSYGSTETTSDITNHEIQGVDAMEKIPIGLPIHNTIVYILDQDLKPLEHDEIGEIYIAGSSVCEDFNGDSFIENPFEKDEPYKRMFKTGDLGMIHGGLLFYEGTKVSLIEVDGTPVSVSEIEMHINSLDYVTKCAIHVHHLTLADQYLTAFVTMEKSKTLADLKEDLSSKLADYMIPDVQIIESFPTMSDGTVDRLKLLKMFEDREAKRKSFEMSSEVSKKISQAFSH